MQIVTGTSGYDYPEWVGAELFYPASLAQSRQNWLTYYASRFPFIELNFTYYGETSPKQLEQMLRRVEPGRALWLLEGQYAPRPDFAFVVKTYASLTHTIDENWPQAASKFKQDLRPLSESGKLLGVLAQFPSRAHLGTELMAFVAALGEALAPLQVIVEFRHAPWYAQEVQSELAATGLVVAGVDVPQEAKLPTVLGDYELNHEYPDDLAQATAVTAFRYIRMHGRKEGSWWSGDAASRYEYNYSESQLSRLANRLIEADSDRVYVAFNNHRFAQAPRNAVRLQELLD